MIKSDAIVVVRGHDHFISLSFFGLKLNCCRGLQYDYNFRYIGVLMVTYIEYTV